jgi:hypothetical protein
MTRLLLRALNTPALIFMAVVGVAIQTSLFSFWPLQYLQPDIILLLVIWCALRRDFLEGGVVTLLIARLAEVHSGAPSGVFLITYMLVYLGVRLAARLLVIPDLSSFVLVTLIVTAGAKISTGLLTQLLGAGGFAHWKHAAIFLVPEALVNGMMGKWVFRWLERFDWATFRNIHAERALDGELQLEVEGL